MRQLRDVLARASARARELGRPVLACVAQPMAPVDPLDSVGNEPPAMYWCAADRSLELAGHGAAATVTSRGPDRFADAGRQVERLLAGAVLEPAGERPPALGGFGFVDDDSHADWRDFAAASLVIPRLVVRREGERCTAMRCAQVTPSAGAAELEDTAAELDLLLECVATSRAEPLPPLGIDTVVADSGATPEWLQLVAAAIEAIRRGELRKVVVARLERTPVQEFAAAAALRHLRDAHAGAFIYGVWRGESVFLGASPERLLRVTDGSVATSALAGSIRRGASATEDSALGAALTASAKDQDEHALVLHDLRAALDATCVDVTVAPPQVVTLPHVQHLHTGLQARLRGGVSALDLLARLHPTPAVGGAPRDAALAFLRVREVFERGWYAGAVGWFDGRDAEFAVALRCALVRKREALLYAGCGIVAGSDAVAEWEESQLKLRPAVEALAAGTLEAHDLPARP